MSDFFKNRIRLGSTMCMYINLGSYEKREWTELRVSSICQEALEAPRPSGVFAVTADITIIELHFDHEDGQRQLAHIKKSMQELEPVHIAISDTKIDQPGATVYCIFANVRSIRKSDVSYHLELFPEEENSQNEVMRVNE